MLIDIRRDAVLDQPHIADPGPLRLAAIATWRARMINEWSSSRVFAALAEQMRLAAFDEREVKECAGFADEERKHGIFCGAVVEALGGEATFELPPSPPLPEHRDASPFVAVLRNAMHVGCFSETVAVALIGAERNEMPECELRALLTLIWADEIGHARFGWRMLARYAPNISAEDRAALARYVPVALAHLDAHELAHLPDCDAPQGGAKYGLCSGRAARVLYRETVATVIVPRLVALGIA